MKHWDPWVIFGFLGQFIFGMRFIVQWFYSERKKESYIPIPFWYISIVGGVILLAYAVYKKDPVFIMGQGSGLLVYIRNLVLIRQKQQAEVAVTLNAPQQRGA